VASFLPLVQLSSEMAPQPTAARALEVGAIQPSLGMASKTMHIHPTCLIGVRGWVESQVLWCNAHNVWVGDWMVELATLQLMQPGARSTTGSPTNQELEGPPP
jgi:hypothetical protein